MLQNRIVRRAGSVFLLGILMFVIAPGASFGEEPPKKPMDIMVSTHTRLSFPKDVQRVAVADPDILEDEVLSAREVLLLGKKPGRTTVLIWFDDGSTDFYLFQVRRDLSLLEEALKEIYPTITVQSAPDRDAVVLRGLVPDVGYANAAEEAAQRYLDARRGRRGGAAAVALAPGAGSAEEGGVPGEGRGPASRVEAVEAGRGSGVVINLIRVEMLPGRLEDRMVEAIQMLGIDTVQVRRMIRGRMPSDDDDIFVLEGYLDTQIQLIRVLSLAQSLLGSGRQDEIRVRADESGALTDARTGGSSTQSFQGSRSLTEVFGSGSGGRQLQNLIDSNLGRAKVIEAAQGRILSFIEVTDLPQVRVDIRLYEVNTTKLRQYRSNWALLLSNFTQPSLNPSQLAGVAQGDEAARVGAMGQNPDVQNVLGFLSGTLSNQFQLSGDNVAIDAVLSLLETQGWARSLSRPSLTVLSGERAFFQVGGEIPIPQSFATTTVAVGDSVFNSVDFKPFGVQLAVRPLVGEDGRITMDVVPEVSIPDAQLTAAIRASTGTRQETTSFRTRYLRTTAILDDGQAMLIGGILSRNMQSTNDGTPGISDMPLVGGIFDNYSRQGDEVQLVIVVHPVVERRPSNKARLWAFPTVHELMSGVRAPAGQDTTCR